MFWPSSGELEAPSTTVRADYSPQTRAEQLIAVGRFLLAAFSLIAIWVDPATPARLQKTTYALMLVYVVYALVVVFAAWRAPLPSIQRRLASHLFDLAAFSIFIHLTEGPVSPFFLYFVFSLFCATLRFKARGTLLTALAAVLIYVGMGLFAGVWAAEPSFELNRFAIRTVYLVVLGALFVYLASYQDRLLGELASLASWPREMSPNLEGVLRESLHRSATIFRVPRMLLIWEEPEEPWLNVTAWSGGELTTVRKRPDCYQPLVSEELESIDFIYGAPSAGRGEIYFLQAGQVQKTWGSPINPDLLQEQRITSCLSFYLEGEGAKGRLFALDRDELTPDDLALGGIVTKLIMANMDQYFFVQQARKGAISEERLRIARDLHDGVVQSLTGIALQLEAAGSQLREDPDRVLRRLREIQSVIEDDQRELRAIVRGMRPPDGSSGEESSLTLRLESLTERFLLEWGMTVRLEGDGFRLVPAGLNQEVYRITSEALANAAKHGGASDVTVAIEAGGEEVRVRVIDNGRGFPFQGRFDLAALERMGQGPGSLKARVAALGGSLTVDSGSNGACVEVRLPLTSPEEVTHATQAHSRG